MRQGLRSLWTWSRRLSLGALLLLVLAAGTGALTQWALTRKDASRFPPPGRLVPAGATRLHLLETGAAGPVVVFDAPAGASHLAWARVQPEVAAFARAVSYDRAGYGWSEPGPPPRTSGRAVEELRALLKAAGLPPPYVLVGNSLGGLNVRLYALRHPEEVAGLVLVEPVHEDQFEALPETERPGPALYRILRAYQFGARLGLLRLLQMPLGEGSSETLPEALVPAARAAGYRTDWVDAVSGETRGVEASLCEVREAREARGELPLGETPLWVLTRGPGPEDEAPEAAQVLARWTALHESLARESSRGVHLVVPGSGHFIQSDRPEAVVEAVRAAVGAGRGGP